MSKLLCLYHKGLKLFNKATPIQQLKLLNKNVTRTYRGQNLIRMLLSPPGENPHALGQLAISASSLFGLGSLCFYGWRLKRDHPSSERAIGRRAKLWPKHIKERIRATYSYFGASVFWTAGAASMAFRSRLFMRLLKTSSWMVLLISVSLQILTGIGVLHMRYEPGLISLKHFMWILHSCVMGITIAPMCYIGGPVLLRAFMMTSGVILGLSAIAISAPEEKFLAWSAPLAIGLGFIFMSTIGSFILPQTTTLGMSLFSLYLYGGMIFFSIMLLHDTQGVIKRAETVPDTDPYGFDPINAALSLYMDALNVIIRFVQLYALHEIKKRTK